MKKLFIFAFIVLFFNINAQEKSRKELKGNKYSFSYSYDKAIDSYNNTKQLSVDGQRQLADIYHKKNNTIKSEEIYSKLISNKVDIIPEDYYNYAMVLKSNGKYYEASQSMERFCEQKPEDLRAKSYLANSKEFNSLLQDNGKYKIQHLNVNTDAVDFGTCFYKDKIVYSSTRTNHKMLARKYNWNGKPFWNMYVSEVENGQLKDPVNFSKSLNGRMHDGPASFSKDGNYMAFTRNNYHDKTKDRIVELQIFFSNYKDDKWSTPEPFILNNPEYSVGHPCLTSDGNTMYFTSDMPGGYGKADIYKVIKNTKGEWSKAENLGNKVNTEGDEVFPFYEETNSVLFFASNGHYGLGGLDIFAAAINSSGVGSVTNAGLPLNTQYDDFAVIIDGKTNKGYFTSNRSGGSGSDDIYSLDMLKDIDINKQISGIAKDKGGDTIPNSLITLFDDKGNVVCSTTTKENAVYNFFVDTDKSFKLNGSKESYIDGDTVTNTFGKELIVIADVVLLKKEDIIVQKIAPPIIKIDADLGKILAIDNIYFDLDKYNIRPDAEVELDKIVKVMNEYPEMIVELSSHTDCRASKEYNQILSNNRAIASANYIKERISNPKRIYGKGFGETKLMNGCACEDDVVSNCTDEEYQSDRRTEFIVIKN